MRSANMPSEGFVGNGTTEDGKIVVRNNPRIMKEALIHTPTRRMRLVQRSARYRVSFELLLVSGIALS